MRQSLLHCRALIAFSLVACSPEDVSGRQVASPEPPVQQVGLGSLSDAWGAQED
jgi:hypothetical protein